MASARLGRIEHVADVQCHPAQCAAADHRAIGADGRLCHPVRGRACRFLGLTDPNVVSWGQIIGSNRQYILDASYTVTIPGLAIFITVLAICLVGDGLNDALNPKLRQR